MNLTQLEARQEANVYLLNALTSRLQILEATMVYDQDDRTKNNSENNNKSRKKIKKERKKNAGGGGGGKNKKDEKSIYFSPPPLSSASIPKDFKGIHVDIDKDLMGIDSDVQKRLRRLCNDIPVPSAKFKRAPSDYYDWDLEQRRDCLQAPHINYLCKTMIMRNTKTNATDCSDRTNSKYYMIVIQYTAKMNKEKLQKIVRFLRPEKERMSKKSVNMRVASPEDGVMLSGFGHNAVTPLGMAVKVPMIVSHRVLELPYIWLGGGEVDVKLRMSISDLCRVFNPIIGDLG
mmetsp:Transcript_14496/g.20339  ORF Transcript_14496/g.20339 Transcript_14496/m.20339 type:complete len:289 (-) Transcript_14496:292-1158(-)